MIGTNGEERGALRRAIRDFVKGEVAPGAAERDATGRVAADALAGLAALSAMGITAPIEFGGMGLDASTLLTVIEEIAYGDAALASIYTAHYLALEALAIAGTDDQKRHYLDLLARGDAVGAFALTEPDAGSDIGAIKTAAWRDGKFWRITGTKTFISNASESDAIVTFTKTAPDLGLRGITAFILSADMPGVSFSPPQDKCGLRSAPTYTIYLDDVTVAEDRLLGEANRGGQLALDVLNRGRIDISAMANGIAMRALQLANEHVRNRSQFGQALRDFQAVQIVLGEMDSALQVARLTASWAANVRDSGGDIRRASAIAKYVATENCFSVVDKAVQLHGGTGYMRESEIERLYRDCRVLRIYEGTSQIQLLTVAKELMSHFDRTGRAAADTDWRTHRDRDQWGTDERIWRNSGIG